MLKATDVDWAYKFEICYKFKVFQHLPSSLAYKLQDPTQRSEVGQTMPQLKDVHLVDFKKGDFYVLVETNAIKYFDLRKT